MSEKKPKILYVVESFGGGVFTYLMNLSNRLVEKYDIVIAYSTNYETPKNLREGSYFDKRINLLRIAGFGTEADGVKESQARAELKKIVAEEKPDLIHLHGYVAGQIGRKALAKEDIPLFYTPHGYQFLAEDHNKLRRSIYRMNEVSAAKSGAYTIACSRGELAETLGITDRAFYIKNGLDLDKIDSVRESSVPEHPFTVFTIGAINKQKNPALFNEIAAAMPDVKFVWIGSGDLRYQLTSDNIEVTGWLERDEVIKKADACDVFILTSLWEGLPYTLLEAMYLKKLCIVSNVIGNHDVVFNGENGFVCDSAASFVNAINHAGDAGVEEMKEVAYNDIIEHYSADRMAESYDNTYREVLNKKK